MLFEKEPKPSDRNKKRGPGRGPRGAGRVAGAWSRAAAGGGGGGAKEGVCGTRQGEGFEAAVGAGRGAKKHMARREAEGGFVVWGGGGPRKRAHPGCEGREGPEGKEKRIGKRLAALRRGEEKGKIQGGEPALSGRPPRGGRLWGGRSDGNARVRVGRQALRLGRRVGGRLQKHG